MKGKTITIQLADGSRLAATILYRNGTTRTVRGADGYIYDVNDYDEYGVWYVS